MAATDPKCRSGDAARDVRGFATRFYTDAGNLDIVGINLPIFFIQDAMQFPDMVHALKPQPDKAIPQAATAHDTAYDFFSQQPSTMNMVSTQFTSIILMLTELTAYVYHGRLFAASFVPPYEWLRCSYHASGH
jgi:catalase